MSKHKPLSPDLVLFNSTPFLLYPDFDRGGIPCLSHYQFLSTHQSGLRWQNSSLFALPLSRPLSQFLFLFLCVCLNVTHLSSLESLSDVSAKLGNCYDDDDLHHLDLSLVGFFHSCCIFYWGWGVGGSMSVFSFHPCSNHGKLQVLHIHVSASEYLFLGVLLP